MKRASKKATIGRYSDYWLDNGLFDFDDDGWDDDLEDDDDVGYAPRQDVLKISRLASVRRAVANFVNILSGKEVPVEFSSGKDSYTDGKKVVIAADENIDNFDSMVGLALHEGSHVLMTDFRFIHAISELRNRMKTSTYNVWSVPNHGDLNFSVFNRELDGKFVLETLLPPKLAEILTPHRGDKKYNDLASVMCDDLHQIMNIIEDRRIDKYVYNNAVGYRPYYDALYARYFFTKEVIKNLKFNPEWREITIDNYILRLLYAFHPEVDLDALPGLRSLINIMDLDNIERLAPENDPRTMVKFYDGGVLVSEPHPTWLCKVPVFEETPILWQVACQIYIYIIKYAKMGSTLKNNKWTILADSVSSESMDELPNLDGAPESFTPTDPDTDAKGRPGKFNPAKAQKDMDKAKDVQDNKLSKKRITKANQNAVTAMEEADAKMVDLAGNGIPGGKCMVIRKLTDNVVSQGWFPFRKDYFHGKHMDDSIAAGRRMGQILLHRLQVRNDPLYTKQTRLSNGGIDRRLLSQLGMDIESVFYKSRIDIHKPVMLHLTLDASSSMHGKKWNKVVSVAVALAYVASKMRNVDVVVTMRGGENGLPVVVVVFDSRKDIFQTLLRNFRKIGVGGTTPEGLCFKATLGLIMECSSTHDVYFINFSDGEPYFQLKDGKNNVCNYQNHVGEEHTRIMVQILRDNGVNILSYYISEGKRPPWLPPKTVWVDTHFLAFKRMYGADSVNVNVENATEVLRTLNKLLLVRG